MKEALRKLQWCPHRRTTVSFDPPGPPSQIETVGGVNAYTTGAVGAPQIEIATCIGSQCSQWRWDGSTGLQVRAPSSYGMNFTRGPDGSLLFVEPLPRPPGVDASFTWRPVLGRWDKFDVAAPGQRDGHCGLSGDAAYE